MAKKEYRIFVRGKQHERVDADLMAQLVVLMGRQLAADEAGGAEEERNRHDDGREGEIEEGGGSC